MKTALVQCLVLLFFPVLVLSCKPEVIDPDGKDLPLVFSSLTAGRDTIFTEDTTRLQALATGYQLTFIWSVEKGDLIGSGEQIIFVATPCTVGNNLISCTVKDGNEQTVTKQVMVTVF
jgi:hypothetical protein